MWRFPSPCGAAPGKRPLGGPERRTAMDGRRFARLGSFFLWLFPLSFFSAFSAGGCAGPERTKPVQVVVLSYNIHRGVGGDGRFDLDRVARVIRRARPDLAALQEVDQGTRRSKGILQARVLGEKTGLSWVFAKAMDYDGGEYGEAVLSRFPFLRIRRVPLPAEKGREPRVLLSTEVRMGEGGRGPRVYFLATHLDHLSDAQRKAQVERIRRIVREAGDAPMILAGDLNAQPGEASMKALFRDWTPAALSAGPTFPADRPRAKIDYVLFRPAGRWRVREARVLEESLASDHRPLRVVLELLPPRKEE